MPVCPECSFWTPDFSLGDVDHNGTWFCNGCWQAWEDQRREQRLTTGKLLPEDRVLWYSNSTSAYDLDDMDSTESMKLQLYEQFCGDSSWLEVDTYGLCLETYFNDFESSVFLHNSDEKQRITVPGESTLYKSLCYRRFQEIEFVFDLGAPEINIGQNEVSSIASLSFIYFSNRLLSPGFVGYRERARRIRKELQFEKEERMKREKEQQELKRKQMIEIQQKQKDLLQIALKRAQNKKPVVSAPPANVWSSATARPSPPPVMMPQGVSTWSSRPMIPPSMPPSWPVPVFIPQPVVDPWAAWVDPTPPVAKRPKPAEPVEPPPDGEVQRQRMTRLGVPFK